MRESFDDPSRVRDPALEVELEVELEALFDPWFQLSEEEIAMIEDDPSAQVLEITVAEPLLYDRWVS